MRARGSRDSRIEQTARGWNLKINSGDTGRYRFAQLDDYGGVRRAVFPHRSLRLSLRGRASANSLPGTWGFGAWNDPFGASLGFGGTPFRLPALPNAIWFFHASAENYLSFRSDKPARGFIAQVFRSPRFHPALIAAGLTFPFSRIGARSDLARIVAEDSAQVNVDVTLWHEYRLELGPNRAAFWVDDKPALETEVTPSAPLGIVIWIDNQYAAFAPDGRLGFGLLAKEPAALEIEDLKISPLE